MKNHALRIYAAVGLVVLLASLAAFAQMPTKLVANIPFDFAVSAKTHPAGQYEIVPSAPNNLLIIRNTDGRGAELVVAGYLSSTRPPAAAQLVFHRYGNQYFLSQIWGLGSGKLLFPAKAEKELMANSAKAETTTVAARRP